MEETLIEGDPELYWKHTREETISAVSGELQGKVRSSGQPSAPVVHSVGDDDRDYQEERVAVCKVAQNSNAFKEDVDASSRPYAKSKPGRAKKKTSGGKGSRS